MGGQGVGGKSVGTRMELTAWPRLNGWISKNANTQSDSNNLNEGISPGCGIVSKFGSQLAFSKTSIIKQVPTFDDFAKNTRGCHVSNEVVLLFNEM